MSKPVRIVFALLVLGAFLLLPGILGAVFYVVGMGGPGAAACTPNVPFLVACVSGTYVLISTATGGIMWAAAFVVSVINFARKSK